LALSLITAPHKRHSSHRSTSSVSIVAGYMPELMHRGQQARAVNEAMVVVEVQLL
jgi:hypothetical protein